MNYFRKIFKKVLNEYNNELKIVEISKNEFNIARLVLGSKNTLTKKEYEFRDDIIKLQDQYEIELQGEDYENIVISFKNGKFTIKTIKYFDKNMSKEEMKKIIEKEIPTNLKIISLQQGE